MASRVCKSLFVLSSRSIVMHGQRSWSAIGTRTGNRFLSQSRVLNMADSKEIKIADTKESDKPMKPEAKQDDLVDGPTDFTPEINPSTFDRFILAWANIYPKMEDVPDRVRSTQIMHARDICRVKICHWMTGILVLLIAIQIINGRREREARWAVYEEQTEREYQEEIRKHEEAKRNKQQ